MYFIGGVTTQKQAVEYRENIRSKILRIVQRDEKYTVRSRVYFVILGIEIAQ